MSYILQFPSNAPIPANARSPPYALFGINDVDYFHDLPPKIPLALVLHFAPKLQQHIIPIPEIFTDGKYLALRTPYVGINITGADIDIVGLKWIIHRVLQVAGMSVERETFLTEPGILSSISIHRAWMALDLPLAGIQGLHTRLQCELSVGNAVTFNEIQAIWAAFPPSSSIVLEMGLNFIRHHLKVGYAPSEFSAIRHWYLATRERYEFFRIIEARIPDFAQTQRVVVNAGSGRVKGKNEASVPQQMEVSATKGKGDALRETNEHKQTEKGVSHSARAKRRAHRRKSDDSLNCVETAIQDWVADVPEFDALSVMPDSPFPREVADADAEERVLDLSDGVDNMKIMNKLPVKRRTKSGDLHDQSEAEDRTQNDEEVEYIEPSSRGVVEFE